MGKEEPENELTQFNDAERGLNPENSFDALRFGLENLVKNTNFPSKRSLFRRGYSLELIGGQNGKCDLYVKNLSLSEERQIVLGVQISENRLVVTSPNKYLPKIFYKYLKDFAFAYELEFC